MSCSDLASRNLSHLIGRRELFQRVGGGIAGMALASLLLE